MNAKQKLLAAAEKIEGQLESGVDALPWHVSETSDDPRRSDTSWIFASDGGDVTVSSFANDPDFALIVTAVNAMPALAAWLRWEAECACVPEHSHKALAVADQILGGAR